MRNAMSKPFAPSFRHFQKDIERLLESQGKREKNEHGQFVYRGYPAAVEEMYRFYLEREAFGPLVAQYRTWNVEWSYGRHIEGLTTRLRETGQWLLLKELWAAIVAKRRTNYNKTKRARKEVPDKVSEELVSKTRDLLLDSLHRLCRYASEFQKDAEVETYVGMIARVERRRNA